MHGYANEALKMFNEMVEMNIKPNGVPFISDIVLACMPEWSKKEVSVFLV